MIRCHVAASWSLFIYLTTSSPTWENLKLKSSIFQEVGRRICYMYLCTSYNILFLGFVAVQPVVFGCGGLSWACVLITMTSLWPGLCFDIDSIVLLGVIPATQATHPAPGRPLTFACAPEKILFCRWLCVCRIIKPLSCLLWACLCLLRIITPAERSLFRSVFSQLSDF